MYVPLFEALEVLYEHREHEKCVSKPSDEHLGCNERCHNVDNELRMSAGTRGSHQRQVCDGAVNAS